MSQHDLILLAIALVVILAVVVAIARFRVHPFPALVIGALILGLWSGAPADLVLKSFRVGFGETLANVGVLLALGAMFGALLASSGGAEQVSSALLKVGGIRMVPWTMCAVSMILGLPLFFEAGVVLMMPIILSVGARLAKDPARPERQSLSAGRTAGVRRHFGAACAGAAASRPHGGDRCAEGRSGHHAGTGSSDVGSHRGGGGAAFHALDCAACQRHAAGGSGGSTDPTETRYRPPALASPFSPSCFPFC